MSDISQRITALSPAKRELLLKRIQSHKEAEQQSALTNLATFGMTVEELKAEAKLAPEIYPQNKNIGFLDQPKCVFLTGATGFVGAFLLDEILQQTKANIYCLVRADDLIQGKQRIQKNLESYFIWNESKAARIIPIIGDLTQPLLGLKNEQFQIMSNKIDVIYHCGALVKWTYPYKALKAANVFGTHEIIRLACQNKVKAIHFISTVGLFSSPNRSNSAIAEDEVLENSGTLYNGYAQSKWVAEKLIRLAELRGLPISIHRPNTEGHSKTGVFNHDDHLCKIIKGCIQLGSVPIDLDIVVASAPIDYVSKAIIYLSRRNESQGKAFHLVNPQPLKWNEWINLICSLGYSLKQLSYNEWKVELMKEIKVSQDNELYTLSPFFSDSILEAVKMPVFDCKNTLDRLAETSIACPAIDSELLNIYFSYFRDSGFLPPVKNNGNSP